MLWKKTGPNKFVPLRQGTGRGQMTLCPWEKEQGEVKWPCAPERRNRERSNDLVPLREGTGRGQMTLCPWKTGQGEVKWLCPWETEQGEVKWPCAPGHRRLIKCVTKTTMEGATNLVRVMWDSVCSSSHQTCGPTPVKGTEWAQQPGQSIIFALHNIQTLDDHQSITDK